MRDHTGQDGVVGGMGEDVLEPLQGLKEALQENIVNVLFKKKDGSDRLMKCTLMSDIIPKATKEDPLSQKKIRQISDEVLPVWDTEKESWRSFRKDSVIEWST